MWGGEEGDLFLDAAFGVNNKLGTTDLGGDGCGGGEEGDL